jgi:hypothetical protein
MFRFIVINKTTSLFNCPVWSKDYILKDSWATTNAAMVKMRTVESERMTCHRRSSKCSTKVISFLLGSVVNIRISRDFRNKALTRIAAMLTLERLDPTFMYPLQQMVSQSPVPEPLLMAHQMILFWLPWKRPKATQCCSDLSWRA